MTPFPLPRCLRGKPARPVAALLILLVLLPVAAPAVAQALSLDRAVAMAVQRAPVLEARRASVTAAGHDAVRAGALPDPRLTVGVDNLPISGPGAFGFEQDMMTMKRVGLMQEVPSRAKRKARERVAARGVEQARALAFAERLAIQRAAASAWVALWAAERELQQLEMLREQSALAVELAKTRLAGATGTATEAMAAQTVQLQLANRIDTAEAQVEAARAGLTRWLGESPTSVAAASPAFNRLPVPPARLMASVERLGPLLAWESREATAAAEVALAAAEKRPDWSIAAAYGQREGGRSDMLMLEFSIDLPLFTGNRQDRDIAARRAELEAVAAAREDARRAQLVQLRRDLAQWSSLKRQVERDRAQLLPLAHDRTQVALARYRGGGPLEPWLDARGEELRIHIEHVRRLGELGQTWAALAYLLPRERNAASGRDPADLAARPQYEMAPAGMEIEQ